MSNIKKIVIFSNCAGHIITQMFNTHIYTKDKYSINYITNYEHLDKKKMDKFHTNILNNCDIFMYQPLNQVYTESEYDITNIKKYINPRAIILKINFYRFRGFWYNSTYKPYEKYNKYRFHTNDYFGIHNSFNNYNSTNKSDITNKINNIQMNKNEFLLFFNDELAKFKKIDNNCDIKMTDYFMNNYKNKRLFHDPFHPTNLFFYEMFRQIILKLDNYKLINEDYNFIGLFNNIDLTHWSLPILPIVKKHLKLQLEDNIFIFYPPENGNKKLYMNIYDYYYIRLSHENFRNYLATLT